MRMYFTTAEMVESGEINEVSYWDSSKRAAGSRRAYLRKMGYQAVNTDMVEVPTTKRDLLRWLNDCSTTAEG